MLPRNLARMHNQCRVYALSGPAIGAYQGILLLR